jgi:hypothetical protein
LTGAARSLLLSGDNACPIERMVRAQALDEATQSLRREQPEYSAATVLTRAQRRTFAAVLLVLIGVVTLAPQVGGLLLVGAIAAGYLANAAFRGWLFWVGADHSVSDWERASELGDLPMYTVLVPLYREANMLPQVAHAMRQLDYPRERLDLKLIVEEDDYETVAAATLIAESGFEIIVVPPGEPRTKPRACNYALQFARGEFLVIFDAEDRPEPHQLKQAVASFRTSSPQVACLQARLNFFNARECWITSGIMAQTPQAI